MRNVSGMAGAAPVWAEIMNRLHRELQSEPPRKPKGVVAAALSPAGESGARQIEFFISGTEPLTPAAVPPPGNPRITYPPAGMILALDPDIPGEYQRLLFESEGRGGGLQWRLDGALMGSISSSVSWEPVPGRHVLAIVDSHTKVVDEVHFDVRGGGTAAPAGRF
jgi:penicillin-binding protein 1C